MQFKLKKDWTGDNSCPYIKSAPNNVFKVMTKEKNKVNMDTFLNQQQQQPGIKGGECLCVFHIVEIQFVSHCLSLGTPSRPKCIIVKTTTSSSSPDGELNIRDANRDLQCD